jgi:hypothetical protein
VEHIQNIFEISRHPPLLFSRPSRFIKPAFFSPLYPPDMRKRETAGHTQCKHTRLFSTRSFFGKMRFCCSLHSHPLSHFRLPGFNRTSVPSSLTPFPLYTDGGRRATRLAAACVTWFLSMP